MVTEMTPEDRDNALVNFLRQEEGRCVDTALDESRASALAFYRGDKFGNEEEGRSQVVTRDVAEVIDYQVVSILSTMLAGGKVVSFETDNDAEDGKDYGQEISESVQYTFMRKQKGYRILHDSLKAGLLEKSGIVKTAVEISTKVETIEGVPPGMVDDDGTMQGAPVESAEPMEDGTYRLSVRVPNPPVFRDEAVPNEEFRCVPDARDLDEAAYIAHVTPKSLSDLARMGFDMTDLEGHWGDIPAESLIETARDANRSNGRDRAQERTGVNRIVYLREEYPLWDYDGDGIAERLCVHRVGTYVLRRADTGMPSITPVDEQPFSLWTPFPMAHRLIGDSSADKTMDIQAIRSTLLRQGLDSLYLSNAPRTTLDMSGATEDTIDDLLNVQPGAIIRHRGGLPPTPFRTDDTSPQAFQAMEMMTVERESRTGVSRQSKGLNPDSLKTDTASGMAMILQAGDQIQLYLARNFAEMLVEPMFAKRYRLMRKHGVPFRMKIDGKTVEVDPREWPEEIDTAINVGLGTGNREQKLQYFGSLLDMQKEALMGGLRIVGEKQIANTMTQMIEIASLGVSRDFVLDPDTLPPQEDKPDPEMMKVQAEQAQAEQKQQLAQAIAEADVQHKQQLAAVQIEGEREQGAAKLELERQRYEAEAGLAREKAALEAELARDKAMFEANLAAQNAEREYALAEERERRGHELAMKQADNALPKNRPGGDLDK